MQLTHIVQNQRDKMISLWLEPWAEQFDIPPGSTLKVLCDCPAAEYGIPEVEVTDEFLVYYFGSGSRLRIWLDDQEVTSPASWAIPSP